MSSQRKKLVTGEAEAALKSADVNDAQEGVERLQQYGEAMVHMEEAAHSIEEVADAMSNAHPVPKCYACKSLTVVPAFRKSEQLWLECQDCKSLSLYIPTSQDLGGSNEDERNLEPLNQQRLQRLLQCGKIERILDYGCGNGYFVDYARTAGLECEGYDIMSESYRTMPEGQFDAVLMVEVIEHLIDPEVALREIREKLYPNGVLMIESSFRYGQTLEELKAWEYVDHRIGHNLILKSSALLRLLQRSGFFLLQVLNDNVYLFSKPEN